MKTSNLSLDKLVTSVIFPAIKEAKAEESVIVIEDDISDIVTKALAERAFDINDYNINPYRSKGDNLPLISCYVPRGDTVTDCVKWINEIHKSVLAKDHQTVLNAVVELAVFQNYNNVVGWRHLSKTSKDQYGTIPKYSHSKKLIEILDLNRLFIDKQYVFVSDFSTWSLILDLYKDETPHHLQLVLDKILGSDCFVVEKVGKDSYKIIHNQNDIFAKYISIRLEDCLEYGKVLTISILDQTVFTLRFTANDIKEITVRDRMFGRDIVVFGYVNTHSK